MSNLTQINEIFACIRRYRNTIFLALISDFKEILPQVSASIDKADFLVIDAEFTGLMNGRDVSIFDSPKEYYNRIWNGCTGFLLIQFGLSAFYWDSEKKHYMNETYNFYLFPRGRPGPEKMFMCQSSSLDFLIAQGFDFNKLIRDGKLALYLLNIIKFSMYNLPLLLIS